MREMVLPVLSARRAPGRPVALAVALAVALVAAACSGDGAGPEGPEGDDAAADAADEPGPEGSTTTLVPPTPTDPPEIAAPMVGDLELPCGAREFADAPPLPESPGVDATSITIGTGNDRGGIASFDSGRGIVEAVVALADHCNGLGGLLGREIVIRDYDAAVVETVERFAEACSESLAMVGHRFLRAREAALAAEACPIPAFPAGPLTLEPFPLHGQLAAIFASPAEASSVVLVRPDTVQAALESERRTLALAGSPAPIAVVDEVVYPVDRIADWDLVVGTARASGAGLVHLEGGCDHAVVPFLSIAAAAGWAPIVLTGPAAYDPACLVASELTERLLVEVPFLPYEDGDAAPVTAEHAGLFDAIGGHRTGDALLAASAFWRFVTAVAECGTDLDRECLVAEAMQIDAWTGAGLHPAVGLDGSMEPCMVVLGVEDGEFVRRLPTEAGTLDCSPELSVGLPG